MKIFLTAAIFVVAGLVSRPAQAQEFPNWPLSATCDNADLQCPRFEQRARGEASGVWNTLPPKVRENCLNEVEALEPSYRLLSDCLALAMQESLKNQQRNPEGGDVVHDTPAAKTEAETTTETETTTGTEQAPTKAQ